MAMHSSSIAAQPEIISYVADSHVHCEHASTNIGLRTEFSTTQIGSAHNLSGVIDRVCSSVLSPPSVPTVRAFTDSRHYGTEPERELQVSKEETNASAGGS